MVTLEEALAATNPDPAAYNLPADASADEVEAKRKEAALNIMAGSAANDVYWNHRPELEALKAGVSGHGEVSVDLSNDPAAKAAAAEIASANAGAIEATVVSEEPAAPLPAALPDNPAAAIATLRKQLADAGVTPEV